MKIQISKIRENPNNPRHVFDEAAIDALAASMQAQGQLVACVVRNISPDTYMLVSGARRYRAAGKIGWTELECEAVDNSEGDEAFRLMEYNGGKALFWLEKYKGIDYARSKNPNMAQKDLANRLEVDQQFVSRAIKSLSLLNKTARELIYGNPVKSNHWQVPEAVVWCLFDITTGQQGDQDRVEQALKVALERKMTEQQAKKLVAWVKKGNSPETFPQDGKLSGVKGAKNQRFDQDDPKAEAWKCLAKSFQVHRTPKGYRAVLNLDEAEAQLVLYGAMAWKTALEQKQAGITGQPNEFMDACPKLLDGADKVEISQESIPEFKSSQSSEVQPVKQASPATSFDQETKNDKLESLNTMITGIASSGMGGHVVKFLKSKHAQTAITLAKKGIKKIWEHFKKNK